MQVENQYRFIIHISYQLLEPTERPSTLSWPGKFWIHPKIGCLNFEPQYPIPVLFIIYMNDLSEFCIQSKPTFFADDTTLLVTSPNKDLLNKIMAKELKVVNNWLATNKLCLNVGKTKWVSLKVKSPQNLFLDEMKIQECKTMKYLGVHIDNELKFLDHIDSLKKKLSKAVGIASQLRYFVSRDVLLKYYNFYVKPILQYGILVYGCTYITHLKKIALMQRKLLRLIFFKRKTMSIESEMINAHILSVPQLYVYELIKFAFRSVRKEVSSDHLNNLYTRAKRNRSRSNKKTLFQLPLHSNNWEKHSLRYRGTNILNFLIDEGLYPNDIRTDWLVWNSQLERFFITNSWWYIVYDHSIAVSNSP